MTVPFSATDNLSGFDASGTLSATMDSKTTSGEGTALSVTSDTITDWAGNTAAGVTSATFMVDKTAPVVTVVAADSYGLGQQPADGATATWSATDNLSGFDALGTPSNSGGSIDVDTSKVGGPYSVYSPTVYDWAGNSAAGSDTYYVRYSYTGSFFLPPINTDGHISGFKQGSTIPVKFQLTDYYGNPVQASNTPTISVRWCNNGTPEDGDLEVSTVLPTTTGNLFRWDPSAQQYIYNLNTKLFAKNNTYEIKVTLDDGTAPSVQFFVK